MSAQISVTGQETGHPATATVESPAKEAWYKKAYNWCTENWYTSTLKNLKSLKDKAVDARYNASKQWFSLNEQYATNDNKQPLVDELNNDIIKLSTQIDTLNEAIDTLSKDNISFLKWTNIAQYTTFAVASVLGIACINESACRMYPCLRHFVPTHRNRAGIALILGIQATLTFREALLNSYFNDATALETTLIEKYQENKTTEQK